MNKIIEFLGKQLKAQAPVITALAAKGLFNQVKKRFTFEVSLREDTLIYNQLEYWLFTNHRNKFQNVGISSGNYNEENEGPVFEQRNDSFFIWFDGHPIYVSKSVEVDENSYNNRERGTYVLKTVWNKSIISMFLKDMMSGFIQDKTEDDKLTVYTFSNYWKTHKKYYPKSMDHVILNHGVKESILNSINTWKEDNELLKSHGISTSLTHLYSGLPGTGKSSISASVAHHYGMDLYYLDLSGIIDLEDLKRAFDQVENNSILLIEDIDLVYKGRKRISKTGVKFDAFINFLSGVLAKNDIMIIMTTNHIENLDPAMIRAGRVDLQCNFGKPSLDMVIAFLTKFYDVKIVLDDVKCMPISMAELEQWCIKHLRDVNGVLNILNNEPCEKTLSSRNSGKTTVKVKSKKKKNSQKKLSDFSAELENWIEEKK